MRRERSSKLERALSVLIVLALLWFVGLLGVLGAVPLPSTVRGWLALLVLGPPLALLSEFLLEFLMARLTNSAIGQRLSDYRVSVFGGTIFLLLIATLAVVLTL